MTPEELIDPIRDTSTPIEQELITNAYHFARDKHAGQKRKSGEDFFVHCFTVAQILAELHLDPPVIAAGLLHDVVEDNEKITMDDIVRNFGEEVSQLVDGVTKLDQISLAPDSAREIKTREAEYLRKTLMAMDDDVRVILIKLADRLHNMRTLRYLPEPRRQAIARETLEIFAPLASRLGIWQWKWELEDLGLRYLKPDTYKSIAQQIDKRRADRETNVADIVSQLESELQKQGIAAHVSGRPKHIYSIYRKMEDKGVSFEELYDIRAVRVLAEDIPACYQVLGVVHDLWRPIPSQFDDYIGAPKDNSYQSLHTAVMDANGDTLEVQIRTHDMHQHAEWGIAAHWRYKVGSGQRDEIFERWVDYLRRLMAAGKEVSDADEFLDVIRAEVFLDRVYAFTPNGDIIDLPAGSTPIDFAYYIHTDIGHRCRGAKVNGRLVGLDYRLNNGDRVQILTVKRGGPSRDWLILDLGFARTKRARTAIRQWFRRQNRDGAIAHGREVLDRELKRLGVDNMSHDHVAALFDLDKTDEFLARVGFGDIHSGQIASRVLDLTREIEEVNLADLVTSPGNGAIESSNIQVLGTGGLLTNLARCCNPIQSDQIIGYITRGRGVTIHRKECPNVLRTQDRDRLIEVEWSNGLSGDSVYPVTIIINAYDRAGLMRDVSQLVADEHVNMREVQVNTHNNLATLSILMEFISVEQLSRVLAKLEQLPNVIEARRRTSG